MAFDMRPDGVHLKPNGRLPHGLVRHDERSADVSILHETFQVVYTRMLVIADGHKGIQKAVEKSFLGASWQISLTEVSESFDEVETCVTYIS